MASVQSNSIDAAPANNQDEGLASAQFPGARATRPSASNDGDFEPASPVDSLPNSTTNAPEDTDGVDALVGLNTASGSVEDFPPEALSHEGAVTAGPAAIEAQPPSTTHAADTDSPLGEDADGLGLNEHTTAHADPPMDVVPNDDGRLDAPLQAPTAIHPATSFAVANAAVLEDTDRLFGMPASITQSEDVRYPVGHVTRRSAAGPDAPGQAPTAIGPQPSFAAANAALEGDTNGLFDLEASAFEDDPDGVAVNSPTA